MPEENILYVCNGCCCGHPEKGNHLVLNDRYAALLKAEGLDKHIAIEKPYCLGPCRLANVVKALVHGRMYWFRQVNTEDDVREMIAFLKNPKEIPQLLQKKQVFF